MTVLSHRESSLPIERVLYPMRKFKVTVERVVQICVGIAAFVFFGAVRTVLGYVTYLFLVLFFAYSTAFTVSYVAGVFISYYPKFRAP
jgi:hypothetical protein